MNLMNLHQDTFQDIQELKDQYMAMNRVCDELELLLEGLKVMQGQSQGKRGDRS